MGRGELSKTNTGGFHTRSSFVAVKIIYAYTTVYPENQNLLLVSTTDPVSVQLPLGDIALYMTSRPLERIGGRKRKLPGQL